MWLLCFLIPAYLMGMTPFAVVVAKLAGHDVYREGSKNPGASNVARIAGWKWGTLAMLLDISKGFIPTLLAVIYSDNYVSDEQARFFSFLIAAAAMFGHVMPIGRKGGKGIATGGGAIVVLFPVPGLAAIVIWIVSIKITKLPVISSLIAAGILPIWIGLDHDYIWEFIVVVFLYAFVVVRHLPNIKRLINREEQNISKEGREV